MLQNKKSNEVFFYWAGLIAFKKSLEIQKSLRVSARKAKFCFFGFESDQAVISMGFRSDPTHILWTQQDLEKHNILKQTVKRGGEATLHAPGQLVIYPVVYLPWLGLKVKDFIVALEEITRQLLEDFGIKSEREGKYAGLHTDKGKICFFGIHISEGISGQGLSININNDLSLFESIKSCGELNRKHDSLSSYSQNLQTKEEIFLKWCKKATEYFSQLKALKEIKNPYFVKPTSPDFVKPTSPNFVKPTSPDFVKPTSPDFVKPTSPDFVKPTSSVIPTNIDRKKIPTN